MTFCKVLTLPRNLYRTYTGYRHTLYMYMWYVWESYVNKRSALYQYQNQMHVVHLMDCQNYMHFIWTLSFPYLPGNGQAGSRSPLTTFQDAVRHCQTASYLEQHMSHIKPTVKHRGMAAVTHKLFGPPAMNSSLHLERNLIFALALCMFKNDEPLHNCVLQTIYKKLTGTKLDCPRYGNHWELIGFQGMYLYCAILL